MTDYNTVTLPHNRRFESDLSPDNIHKIQRGTVNYEYKGVKCHKNPFDMALYTKLIYEVAPKTIIEIGSFGGGSALWFADLLRSYHIDGYVFSLDINPVTNISDDHVIFMEGDVLNLGATFSPEIIKYFPRPILVIEDSAHFYETSLAALDFFDKYLHVGEYIVIEDGNLYDLGLVQYQNGPNRAIGDFLAKTQGRYMIDTEYCDFFGHNMTWNTNGYLKKIG